MEKMEKVEVSGRESTLQRQQYEAGFWGLVLGLGFRIGGGFRWWLVAVDLGGGAPETITNST